MSLPYKSEYSKSGRASCHGCKGLIAQGSLQLAVKIQSPYFDSKIPHWYHEECFFYKQRPKSIEDIEHLESLRIEDQNLIKEKVEQFSAAIIPEKNSKLRKRNATSDDIRKKVLADFKIERTKASRVICLACEQKIMKDEIRIIKKDYNTDIGRVRSGQLIYYHLACFAKIRAELGFFESAEKIPGFKGLKTNHRAEAIKQLPPIYEEDIPDFKKLKTDTEDTVSSTELKELTTQNKILYKYIDTFKVSNMAKSTLTQILEYNEQSIPSGYDEILEHVADIMTFGALLPCKICKSGNFVFKKHEYVCVGSITEKAHCQAITKEPKRKPCLIPPWLKNAYSFLKSYKYKPRTRLIPKIQIINTIEDGNSNKKVKVKREVPPLYDMSFFILGKIIRGRDNLKNDIYKLGGKVGTKLNKYSIMAVISTPEYIKKITKQMTTIKLLGINVVSEDFVDEAKNFVSKIPDLLKMKSIADWEVDYAEEPSTSFRTEYSMHRLSLKSRTFNGQFAYSDGPLEYACLLVNNDVQNNNQSYFKMLILEDSYSAFKEYEIFTSCGRIGTYNNDIKVFKGLKLTEAIAGFEKKYKELTGNVFNKPFMKVEDHYVPIEMDDELDIKINSYLSHCSYLSPSVQELMYLIFDEKSMKRFMLDFIHKPLYILDIKKINMFQIEKALEVLYELQNMIDSHCTDTSIFIFNTNQFYTLIPLYNRPLINNPEIIKQKFDVLDSLMQFKEVCNLVACKSCKMVNIIRKDKKSIYGYYKKLNAKIDVLSRDSEDFVLIQEYVKNTTLSTCVEYDIIIDDIYTVKRTIEKQSNFHNYKLLWHGSRVPLFAGILSGGFRCFQKYKRGVHFADAISQSAFFCHPSPSYPTGLMLLCEVALGDITETECTNLSPNLTQGINSLKVVGNTYPDPSGSKILNGVEVPCGHLITENNQVPNHFNEYIVFDAAQIKIKYLLKLNFKFK